MGGDYLISVLVSDGHFNVYQNFSINVPNQAPKINSMANVTAIKGVPYEYLVNATDADRDMLAFSLVSDVPGMTIDAQKGNLSWTPESTGDFTIKIMVADGKGGMAVQEFLVHVYEKIEPKMDFVTLPEQAVVDGKVAVSGRIIKGSVDVVSIQYRLDSGEWVNVTGNESWEINMDTTKMKNGNHTLQIRAYDGLTYSEIARRSFTVKNPVKEAETPNTPYVIGAIVLIAIFAGALLLVRKKRPPDEEK
jgi:nuclear transport factor 2 (NTF2) superfamily protein